jgi:hypothetical protein
MSFIKIHNCRCDYGAGKRIASVSPDERCREVKLGLLVRGVYLQAGFGAVLSSSSSRVFRADARERIHHAKNARQQVRTQTVPRMIAT